MTRMHLACLSLALVAGDASATGHTPQAGPTTAPPDAPCVQARRWNAANPASSARQVTPEVNEDGNGRHYHFNLSGRAGLRTLDANCGWGSYAECSFKATQADGRAYTFTDLSSFGLWEDHGTLYLLYRIISPTTDADAAKRRLLRLGDPPTEVCNQIGDYTGLL